MQTCLAEIETMIFRVAISRFAQQHVDDVMAAIRALAAASREEPGNLRYDIYRGVDDDAALTPHERTDAFVRRGKGLLMKYATLHDAVTGLPRERKKEPRRAFLDPTIGGVNVSREGRNATRLF
jgi:hypothetical protein